MSRHDKLLERLKQRPRDFTWGELVTLMKRFGFELESGTGSSHQYFYNDALERKHCLSKPHPSGILKRYQIDEVLKMLQSCQLLEDD